jgi:hypothetical protein
VYREGWRGQEIRPWAESAEVKCRQCSELLERALTDFGADESFEKASRKIREHYGIEVPSSRIRRVTLKHGEALLEQQPESQPIPEGLGPAWIIGQVDGCMVPMVSTEGGSGDRRKSRRLTWEEVRLALAHPLGSRTPVYGATTGNVDAAGHQLRHCVIQAGARSNSRIHAVGDGASWIPDQVEDKLGLSAQFLVDFYHVSEYLAQAAEICSPAQKQEWLKQRQTELKINHPLDVLNALVEHWERVPQPGQNTPVADCHRYIENRLDQLDYQGALEKGLPIGSGEIESAHRSVIQNRLKIPGAWWLKGNVAKMLALRTCRANLDWNSYWFRKLKLAA